jgi:DNA invertase Pin-like site-specific DNA recombinase
MASIGYGRVSTRDQNPDAQRDQLTAAGVNELFIDKASGKLASRPQLDAALRHLRAGDVLVITRLDRLGRSTKHLAQLAVELQERQIGLRVLHQGIDTTTAVGRLFFHILAAIAEFEHELIKERTVDGLEAARSRGRNGGRKPTLTPAAVRQAQAMYDSGEHTVEQIAAAFKTTRPTIYRALDRTTIGRKPANRQP